MYGFNVFFPFSAIFMLIYPSPPHTSDSCMFIKYFIYQDKLKCFIDTTLFCEVAKIKIPPHFAKETQMFRQSFQSFS